jgi:hypothetical protein
VGTYGYTFSKVSQLSVTWVASALIRLVAVPVLTALLAQRAAFACEYRRNVTCGRKNCVGNVIRHIAYGIKNSCSIISNKRKLFNEITDMKEITVKE